MSLPTYTGDTDYISNLDDEPVDVGGLTPAQLKAVFDQFGTEYIAWFNATFIPAVTPANIGAETADAAIMKTDEAETMTAVLTMKSGTDYTVKQGRNIRFKTSDHTTDDLSNGEIGFVYS